MLLDKETRLNRGQQTSWSLLSCRESVAELARNIKAHDYSLTIENNKVNGMLLVIQYLLLWSLP